MWYLLTKYAVTAAVVVAVSELAKRSDRLGALIASLPLVTVLTLIWLQVEQQPASKVANHAWYTFWYVIPTLPMFLAFPWMLQRFGFAGAMVGFVVGMALAFLLFALVARRFGVQLL